uniref:CCHC-type domain-containing protein n=1 Tax=Gasterosteus aculeatus aculeatus TaxID=481459 RepID=A0AAQ4QFQ9_GASAC
MQRLRQVFGHSTSLQEAARRLLKLRQGPRSVSDFSIDFRTLATESGWEDSALMPTFYHGLSESLKDELVNRDWGNTLEDLISLATQLDRRRRERQQEKESRGSDDHPLRGLPHSVPEGTPGPEGETVQLRKTRLSPEERDQRRREWLCFYCGKAGHYRNNCPHRRTREQPLTVSTLFCPNISQHQCLVPVTIIGSRGQATTVPALIDSGSAGNFISQRLVQQLQLATLPCSPPLSITAINNQPLGSGFISQVTVPVTLVVGVLHSEELSLLVIDNVSNDVILGLPWLAFHEPQISWNTNELLRWGDKCVSQCLTKPLRTATIRSTATAATPEVPPAYRDLAAVFSKASAECLPPHRPWDCAIDLVPGATLPRDLEAHVRHVRQVLDKLLENHLYVKLEKCEFHQTQVQFLGYIISPQGVQMDEGKVKAVMNWPEPQTIKELQRFLGFANFYRRFVRNFSSVAAPLTSLFKGSSKKLRWNEAAASAFRKLKDMFTSAPVLRHPDPALPFVVEVDASETGVGGVLSQRQDPARKMARQMHSPGSRNLRPPRTLRDQSYHLSTSSLPSGFYHHLGGGG